MEKPKQNWMIWEYPPPPFFRKPPFVPIYFQSLFYSFLCLPFIRWFPSSHPLTQCPPLQNGQRCLEFLDFLVSMLVKLDENFNGKGFHQFENDALAAHSLSRSWAEDGRHQTPNNRLISFITAKSSRLHSSGAYFIPFRPESLALHQRS